MLAEKSYPTEYVETARAVIRAQLTAYDALALSAEQAATFEPGYAELVVLALDNLFTHRMRGQEGKTGTLHEVRQLCESIRARTAPSLTVADAARLAEAFLDEIEQRFPASTP